MHIREVNEQLDYDLFMNEGLPDDAGHGEYTNSLGNRVWALKHGLAKHYGCHACKADFIMLESAQHDLVNVKLGKGVYDPDKFIRAVKLYEKSLSQWEQEGKPLHPDSPYQLQSRSLTHPTCSKTKACRLARN